jgi:uncharacterized damage-inducible protein DinB
MNVEMIQQLYAYNYDLHRKMWKSVMQLSDDQFVADSGYSLGSVRNHLVHVMSVDERWFARVREIDLPPPLQYTDFVDRMAVRAKWDTVEADILAFIKTDLTDEMLTRTLHYETRRLGPRSNRIWQILVHVVNHGTDHRAQILQLLYQHGAMTLEQDFMIYLWDEDL